LDARGAAADEEPNRAPSSQIVNYLIRSEQPWGILTNGGEWRLYFRDADFADTVFYSVDLPALLGDGELALGDAGQTLPAREAFRYFYLFFRPEAFRPAPQGHRWLDLARASSLRYARAVENALKPRAYRAVNALCRGFAAAGAFEPEALRRDPSLAGAVLDNALTLLFRLLFLLYAESRDLLPVRTNPAYRNKSLLALRERAADARDRGRTLFPRGRDFWRDLEDLFEIVDGDAKWAGLGIPVYNGGLFDPAKHPWLVDHYVADPELAEALDLLSRVEDPDTDRLHFVDYTPLDVRQLGSIYEGLLEYVLKVAEEDLPEIAAKGQTVRDSVPSGALYLAGDRGERHTTGSFYTPDYIVQYIVERTLGPLVEERSTAEILEVKVLDPAMGSGHFLVAATAFLARAATRAAAEGPQLPMEDFAPPDPDHLRRLVVERCIFGVDKNPRAVELAKLALWLATVRRDKPLNFLDHHLKQGDSLIGARVAEMGALPRRGGKAARQERSGQVNVFESAFRQSLFRALGWIAQIEQLPSETEADIAMKEALFRQANTALDRFRRAADVWTSALFGNHDMVPAAGKGKREVNALADRYAQTVGALRGNEAEWEALRGEPWFDRARKLVEEHDFFHWDVEFPEVFYEEKGRERENPGFDAVIGNPPYVRMEKFKHLKDFLRASSSVYQTRADLYVYFIERSLDLLRDGGRYGAIVSNKFLRANYGEPLRELVGERAAVEEIVDFGGLPVFPDATVRSAIVLAEKGPDAAIVTRYAPIQSLDFDELTGAVDHVAFALASECTRGAEWRLVPRDVAALLEKVEGKGAPLGEVVEGQVLRGIVTGLNAAFMIDGATRERLISEDSRSAEVLKPLVVGDSIRRYHVERPDAWLLYLPHGTDIGHYPAVEAYLSAFREPLESRATKQEWYELQQPQEAYQEFFDGPKILYPEIAMETRFAFNVGPLYPNNKCFLIPGENWFLLGLLNSRPAWFYLRHISALLESRTDSEAHVELRAQYMERLPVPNASEAEASELAELARRMTDLEQEMRRERSEFVVWLEGEIGCRVDQLTSKTRVLEYDHHDAETLLKVLERNHPRCVTLDVAARRDYRASNPNRQRIAQAHVTSTARLGPLAREFAEADARADELAYRLYGLTEAEIAVIDRGSVT
jgi:hypothetical protein